MRGIKPIPRTKTRLRFNVTTHLTITNETHNMKSLRFLQTQTTIPHGKKEYS